MKVTLRQIAEVKGVTWHAIRKRKVKEKWPSSGTIRIGSGTSEAFDLEDLPGDIAGLFTSESSSGEPRHDSAEAEVEAGIYASAPDWARAKAEKYLFIMRQCAGLKGSALKDFIASWNAESPGSRTSYTRVVSARRAYQRLGVKGLLAKYGKSAGRTCVADAWFEYFREMYMFEGAPSLGSCWLATLGYAKGIDPTIEARTFPSAKSFERRLRREVPEQAVYRARYGYSAWNRKYHCYIEREYEGLKPGECLVSDHTQADVAVMLPDGSVCFPWITAWRDMRSCKWLSWYLHAEAPNSDHVFQSFYHAVRRYGLPTDVYIDNGRDYRCRDFAGGRRNHKVELDEQKASAMLQLLGVRPHFSLPYNAQAKPIERDFLKQKGWLYKHLPGYRGGSVKERPERLRHELRHGGILSIEEFSDILDDFITQVLNRMPSEGKVLGGLSPDELWARDRTEARMISEEALKLFCMRTSRPLTIGRNGVWDSLVGVTYWAEWMSGVKGMKVYLRRDPREYQEAWVFMADSDEYLGRAHMVIRAAALAKTPVEKAELKRLLKAKRAEDKIVRSYMRLRDGYDAKETLSNMQAGVGELCAGREHSEGYRAEYPAASYQESLMDDVVREDKRMRREGVYDLDAIVPPHEDKTPIHLWETDRQRYERERGEE